MSQEKVSLTNPQPGTKDYVVPAAAVPLPSQGKVYPPGSPLSGKKLVEIKAMTTVEEDILTSQALLKSGKALDSLIKSCLIDKSIDVGALLAGDRNALLVSIRITGYGQQYDCDVICPVCGTKTLHSFDLARLPLKMIEGDPISPGVNEFTHTLPSGRVVTYKLLTGNDEKELSLTIDRTKKYSGGRDSLITTRLMFQVLSIDGERDPEKLSHMIKTMTAMDSRSLRKTIEQMSPDVSMKQDFTCPSCTESMEVDVPMGAEFFWPST